MKTVIQRVSEARVEVGGSVVGRIGPGLLVLVCVMPADTTATADRLLQKLLKLRVFNNSEGKLDHDLANVDGHGTAGGLLLVSQFTLSADTHKGNRPSFVGSAPSAQARALFDYLVGQAKLVHPDVAMGRFATEMQVHLVNSGPITIPLDIH
jgi:D-tyrosyl-tRNA(Tyr) deacylase|tara:strand:+ start:328 stop:783 length:456 start_codon:yes stop_codon:yes gene_type:complete